jgi:diguanylate cyclase (GGDEF)-like protein
MPVPTLEQVLACPNLPSLPTVAVDVLSLTSKPNVNLGEISRVVQNDQALCAKILKTVNSSFYGLSKPCPTITRALTYLGLSTVKSLVLGFSLVDWTRQGEDGFDMIEYWRRCAYGAAASRRIATLRGTCDPEEAFIAALMQDLGMPAILTAMGKPYTELLSKAAALGDHSKLAAVERETLQFDHAMAGSKLAERWRLPGDIVKAIRSHHASEATSQEEIVRAVALGYQAALVLTSPDSNEAMARFNMKSTDWFGMTVTEGAGLLATIAEDAREISRLFHINTGNPPNISAILAQAEDAALAHQLNMQREADTLRQTASDLVRQTITDALTKAFNRKHFDDQMALRFDEARDTNSSVGVVMVDADKFKNLNDTYGHQIGDAVLIELARRMREHCVDGIVCRYGGEEFAVILPNATRREAAEQAESLRKVIAATPVDLRHLQGSHQSVSVTVSMGVAVLEPEVSSRITSPQVLLHAADKALYAAKHAGRNCVRVFSPKPYAAAA